MMSPVPGNHRTSLTMVMLLCSAVMSSLLCLVCGQSDHCGTSVVPLINRGRPINQGEYPWLAALYQVDEEGNWTQFCGGALLSPHIVVTAAHCLVFERNVTKPENLRVGLGKLYRDFYHNEDYAIIANVSQVVVHQGYTGPLSSYALDVGLLKLSIPVQMTNYILPVCIDLDTATSISTGAIVHAAGWGTSENGSSTDRALAADLSYLDYHSCLFKIREVYRRYVTPEKMCSLSINGSQVDRGDSGGALTFKKDGRHFIVGVVSTKIVDQTSFSIFTNFFKPDIHLWLMEKTSNFNSPDYYKHFIVASSRRGFNVGFNVGNSKEFETTTVPYKEEHLDYYEYLLITGSYERIYNAHVRNSKEFVITPWTNNKIFVSPAVDCFTGTFYYWAIFDHMIQRQTVNGTDIKNIIIVDSMEYAVHAMTVDWIGRKLYWIAAFLEGDRRICLMAANAWNVESIITSLPNNSRDLTIHPTLRKLYILNGHSKTHSLDLDSLTPILTLFHEEEEGTMGNIDIDWETNDLCWLFKMDNKGQIKCKNTLTNTMRTVLSDLPVTSYKQAFAISSHSYYWSDGRTISVMSKSSSRVETFNHSQTVFGLNIIREPCPTLTPAP